MLSKVRQCACTTRNISTSTIDIYRENLLTLLHPVFNVPAHQCCLASALQNCIAQAALKSFGRPCKKSVQKVNQKWYDAECKSAQSALRNTIADTHEHAVKVRSYKQMLRRKRRAWQRRAQQDLCELASRNPQSFRRHYNERQSQKSNIPREQWKASFENLYKAPEAPSTQDSTTNPVNPTQSPLPACMAAPWQDVEEPAMDFLNADITHEDVIASWF